MDDLLYHSVGLWIGAFIGAFMATHMKKSIEIALDLGEEGALKYTRKAYVFRMAVVAIVFGAVFFWPIGETDP